MSLEDRTNETILLSQHEPMVVEDREYPAEITVDVDNDSSFNPSAWVDISFTDEFHDSERIKMTFDEAELLYERLALILGLDREGGN